MRVLNVAEKPSVAKEASRVLSRGTANSSSGRSRYNRVHQFRCNLGGIGACEMIFTSVTGHLMEMEFSDPGMKQWSGCDPVECFTSPVHKYVPEDKSEIKDNLQDLARGCQVRNTHPHC
jgi:DNA topoisomerase-3|eukprot:SAG25_NODE_167_length_13063_cov_9.799830_11_plen_119_part_00